VTLDQFVREVQLRRERVPSFDQYPFALPVLRDLTSLPLHPKVTFLIGENGTGKSTLIEGIAVAFGLNPEGGSRNFSFGTRPSHSVLGEYLRLVKGVHRPRDSFFLRAESLFNLATEIERLDGEPGRGEPILPAFGGISLHEQSHGESFLAVLRERFGGNAFYLLDEPEAALSPMRQIAMLRILHDLVRAGSQFVIATHSPVLMAYPEAWIYQLGTEGIARIEYQDTEHYQVTRQFLAYPTRMLKYLLAEE
jgi:predicted ATPase